MLGADIDLGLRTLEAYAPRQMLYRGQIMACVASSEQRGITYAEGGKELDIALTLIVRVAVLGTVLNRITADTFLVTADTEELTADNISSPPRSGEIITYQGREYRLIAPRLDPNEGAWRLELADTNR